MQLPATTGLQSPRIGSMPLDVQSPKFTPFAVHTPDTQVAGQRAIGTRMPHDLPVKRKA